ncbi:MAG: hypothetical protein RQ753_05245 [Desulfurivibrionaceae bacterium]|nr:hypothetical protein [Desulfurivibrionaceae bacterium]
MKWLAVAAGVILFLLVAAYLVLFTAPGNRLLAPVVEGKIGRATGLPADLENFELRPGRFALTLFLGPGNRVEAEGEFGLLGRELTATYRVIFDELADLEPLTGIVLHGKLRTEGTVSGSFADLSIDGGSDIAASNAKYSVTLVSFEPGAIKVEIIDAETAQLLELLGKKPFSTGKLSLDLDLRNLDPHALDGEALLEVGGGSIDTALMKKEFDLTLPETSYGMRATGRLQGREISYEMSFESNLARLVSEGSVSPESLVTDLEYEVDVEELALFKPLTGSPLRGPLKTSGTVKGDRETMAVSGTADLGGGRTDYDIAFEDLQARQVLVKINNAELARLLYMAGQPELASGVLNADLSLTDLDPENLKGEGAVKIGKGRLATAVFKQEYDIVLPQTPFSWDLNATLQGRGIDYRMAFDSTLAEIGSEGIFIPEGMGMDLKYSADITRLELLQPFAGMPLRGALKLHGTAKGDRESLKVEGESDLAGGATTFRVGLQDFKPAAISAKISNLLLARALDMLAKPHYGDGVVDVDIEISEAGAGELKGSITSELSRGRLDPKVLAAEFDLGAVPETSFSATAQTTLAGNFIDTAATLDSTLAALRIKRLRYDLDASLLSGDYRAEIPDLDRFYFVTERHLKGGMVFNGELVKGENLKLTARADTLGGSFDATLIDDDLHAAFKEIQTLEALRMLIYPEIFASSLDGSLDYNLALKKGTFSADLSDGKFTRNVMFDLLLSLARTDLYKELFTGTLRSEINQELITSDLALKADDSSIVGENVTLNSKTRVIEARLDVLANNNPIGVVIKGRVDNPQVKLDTSALIKQEAGKVLKKEVDKLLRDLFK